MGGRKPLPGHLSTWFYSNPRRHSQKNGQKYCAVKNDLRLHYLHAPIHFTRMSESPDRYEARPTDQPSRWQVWDLHTNAVVFGCESMRENAAREYAHRLSAIYRDLHPRR